MKFNKDLVGGSVRLLVLSILAGADLHGYDIVRRVNELSGGEMQWREGAIYPVLHKMELDELIEGRWEVAASGRKRRVYSITSEGRRAQNQTSREWKLFSGIVDRILEAQHA